jgi:hypothetical protein
MRRVLGMVRVLRVFRVLRMRWVFRVLGWRLLAAPGESRRATKRVLFQFHAPMLGGRLSIAWSATRLAPLIRVANERPSIPTHSQVRTISMRRIRGAPLGFLADPPLLRQVRRALAHHLGLDIAAVVDLTQR